MPVLFLIALGLLLGGCDNLVSTNSSHVQVVSLEQAWSYQDYQAILETYVNEHGLVDYPALQANRQGLDRFNQSLGTIPLSTYQSWTEAEQIAFWLNAYNSFTLQSIIDQNPLKLSIRDIPGVWKGRRFPILEQSKTLDQIEHDLLRVDFAEPRIHLALVCAAVSCPPLRREPYQAEKLDQQLDDQTRKFLNSEQGFQINRDSNVVYLSSIFKWFGKDWLNSYQVDDSSFTGSATEKAVLNFISTYLEPVDQEYLKAGKYRIRYLNYDWSLNLDNS